MLDKDFLAKQEKKLLKEKKYLEKQMSLSSKFPDYGPSEEENIREVEEAAEHLGIGRNLRDLLKEINNALKKVAKGTYGKCESCRKEIELARLKAFPAASLCIKCAEKPKRGWTRWFLRPFRR